MELYINGDLNKALYKKGTARTVQYIFRWSDDTVYKYGSSAASTDGIVYKMVKTDTGYTLEAAQFILGVFDKQTAMEGFTSCYA